MKKISLFFVAIGLFAVAQAQITITSNDLVNVGDSVKLAYVDTLPAGFNPGPSGANQHWDFSDLMSDTSTWLNFLDPDSTPYGESFPSSNIAVQGLIEGLIDDAWAYGTKNSFVFQIDGVAGSYDIFQGVVAPFTPPEIMFSFPVNYLDSLEQTSTVDIRVESPEPPADSIRIKVVTSVDMTVDAWGELTTPVWTGQVLRFKDTRVTIDSVWVKLLFFWVYLESSTTVTQTYKYMANDMGFPVLQFNADETGTEFSMVNYLHVEGTGQAEQPAGPQLAFILYPNPALHTMHCRIQGEMADGEMVIYDMTGRIMDRQHISSGIKVYRVDVSGYPGGIYQAVIRGEENILGHRKFVVR